jgi:hypothetical protein
VYQTVKFKGCKTREIYKLKVNYKVEVITSKMLRSPPWFGWPLWNICVTNEKPYIEEEQTTQWPKEKVQKDKQQSTQHTYRTKDRVTRTPLKTGGELRIIGVQTFKILLWDARQEKYINWKWIIKLKSSLRRLYGRHHDLVDCYGISVSQMTTDMSHLW